MIKEGGATTTLAIDGRAFNLSGINIESLKIDKGALIVKLLPGAQQFDPRDLIKRYAAMKPFLESA